jgi:hypothetical protein
LVSAVTSRETQRLRDSGMAEMYRKTTINLSHLPARLILGLLDQGVDEIERSQFHRVLGSGRPACLRPTGVSGARHRAG